MTTLTKQTVLAPMMDMDRPLRTVHAGQRGAGLPNCTSRQLIVPFSPCCHFMLPGRQNRMVVSNGYQACFLPLYASSSCHFMVQGTGAQDVAEQVAAAHRTHFLDGVTFSGGEPMQQALDLLEVIRLLKRARPEISVGMYSGYTERELDSGRFWTRYGLAQETRRRIWADIKQHLDFAVLGRFVAARPSKLPMRTSANQVLRLFSDRYREKHFKPLEFEVHIETKGLVQITGFPLAGLPV